MQPQEQQQLSNDELMEKMEALRLQLKQLQEERERAQKIQGGTEDASVANVNKCPLLEVAGDDALTTSKQAMDKPIIPKDSTIRDKLTSHLHECDTKLKIDSKDHSALESTISRTKTINARMHRVAPYNTNKMQPKRSTLQDALAYVDRVKVTLADQPEIYEAFLSLLQGYKNGTTSFTNTMTKMKQLFNGYPELMNGFSAFAPPAYNMNSPIHQDALAYVDRVKVALADEPEIYKAFLTFLQEYKNGTTSFTNTVTKIKQLFNGHPELIDGLITFVPSGYKMNSPLYQDALAYVDRVKAATADQPEIYTTFLSHLQGYKNGTTSFTNTITKMKQLFSGHPELMNGFTTFVPQGYNMNSPTLHAKLIPPIISYYMKRAVNEPEKYRSFLKNLLVFQEKVHDQVSSSDAVLAEEEIMREITKLFKKK